MKESRIAKRPKKPLKPHRPKAPKPPVPINYEAAKALYNTPAYKAWREYCFLRDLYTCQMCGANGVALECHHIRRKVDRPELVLSTPNGITLCKDCHQRIVTGSEKSFEYIFDRIIILNERRKENRSLQNREHNKQKNLHWKLLPYPEAMDQAQKGSE